MMRSTLVMPRGGWKYPTWSEKAIVFIGPPPPSARLRHLGASAFRRRQPRHARDALASFAFARTRPARFRSRVRVRPIMMSQSTASLRSVVAVAGVPVASGRARAGRAASPLRARAVYSCPRARRPPARPRATRSTSSSSAAAAANTPWRGAWRRAPRARRSIARPGTPASPPKRR